MESNKKTAKTVSSACRRHDLRRLSSLTCSLRHMGPVEAKVGSAGTCGVCTKIGLDALYRFFIRIKNLYSASNPIFVQACFRKSLFLPSWGRVGGLRFVSRPTGYRVSERGSSPCSLKHVLAASTQLLRNAGRSAFTVIQPPLRKHY